MKSQLITDIDEKTYAVIFTTGDEVVSGLLAFAREKNISAAHFTAIGAFSELTIGYFNWEKKDYEHIPVREQVEVLSLIGDVALQDGKPKIHAHCVVGRRDGSTRGGHLIEAYVRPTLELMLTESPAHLQRTFDPESGLALIRPGGAAGRP